MEIIKDGFMYKGTNILIGNKKRTAITKMCDYLITKDFNEINIPIIQFRDTFKDKVGIENKSMMFSVKDNNPERDLVLAPEYTAVIQKLSEKKYKYKKDVKLFYVQECFRGENPQAGRYRQFTQFGVEIINPSKDYIDELIEYSKSLISFLGITDININRNAVRGLDYYIDAKGFEIYCDKLGSSKQICGGGAYNGGIGFAIGIDRCLLATINQ